MLAIPVHFCSGWSQAGWGRTQPLDRPSPPSMGNPPGGSRLHSPARIQWIENAVGAMTQPAPLAEQSRTSFEYEELLACGRGELFGPGNAQLPLPPMLMFDRISAISLTGGANGRGYATAELDVRPDLWFFACHFRGDPVMPGCLGLDALWQMLGFFLAWAGGQGRGRALAVGALKLTGQVLPTIKRVEYGIDIKRIMKSKLVLGIADGWLKADGQEIYKAQDLRVGLFRNDEQAAAV